MILGRVFRCMMLALSAVLAAALPSIAHHGFTGRYDRSQPIYVSGTVRTANFGYPHAVLTLDVATLALPAELHQTASEFAEGLVAYDAGSSITVELPPVRLFFDLQGRISVGDQIQMIVLRNCEEPFQYRGQWVAPSSGEPVLRQGRMQTEVSSC